MATQRRSTGARYHQRDSLFRRFFRFIFSPLLLIPLFLIGLVGCGVLYYYYERYSALIDAGLRGDIFVRSSGIYAAPMPIRTGSSLKASDLIAQLKRIGYLERGTTKNEKRGLYAGCVGYFSAAGEMDSCIVLRTALIKDGTMYVQAGAGIVADSDPASELAECVNKAKALFRAAEEARRFASAAGRGQ